MPVDPDTGIPVNEAEYVDRPCGAIDPSAKFPEPAHFDCRECRRIIREALMARKEKPSPARKPLQIPAPWMEPPDGK